MRIISYGFLGISAAVACFLALWWSGTQRKRGITLSFIASIICGASVCLNLSIQMCIAICFLFLTIFFFLIMQTKFRMIEFIITVSISCACFGMLELTIETLLRIEQISLFFRVILILISLTAVFIIWKKLSEEFPEPCWQEYFAEDTFSHGEKNTLGDLKIIFPVYGICLGIPAITGSCSIGILFLEWFGFWIGLRLINQIISSRIEKTMICTERQYRDDMQTYMSVIRSQRHDYIFHVQTLHGLLIQEDYEKCKTYLNQLLKDSMAMNELLPIKDAAISSLIYSFKNKAIQSGISMELQIENDLSQVATNVYETNKVIGNLLQNAIDETETLLDKTYGVKLSIFKRGEFCMISVSNRAKNTDPMKNYRTGYSAKSGHEGIGIASIQALAAKYGGVVYSKVENDIIYFIAKLPLRLIKEEI